MTERSRDDLYNWLAETKATLYTMSADTRLHPNEKEEEYAIASKIHGMMALLKAQRRPRDKGQPQKDYEEAKLQAWIVRRDGRAEIMRVYEEARAPALEKYRGDLAKIDEAFSEAEAQARKIFSETLATTEDPE